MLVKLDNSRSGNGSDNSKTTNTGIMQRSTGSASHNLGTHLANDLSQSVVAIFVSNTMELERVDVVMRSDR